MGRGMNSLALEAIQFRGFKFKRIPTINSGSQKIHLMADPGSGEVCFLLFSALSRFFRVSPMCNVVAEAEYCPTDKVVIQF